MSSIAGLQCLRPYLFRELPVSKNLVYTRFYNTTRRLAQVASSEGGSKGTRNTSPGKPASASQLGKQSSEREAVAAAGVKGRSPVEERIEQLKAANALVYPRIQRNSNALGIQEYIKQYGKLEPGLKLDELVTIRGIYHDLPARPSYSILIAP